MKHGLLLAAAVSLLSASPALATKYVVEGTASLYPDCPDFGVYCLSLADLMPAPFGQGIKQTILIQLSRPALAINAGYYEDVWWASHFGDGGAFYDSYTLALAYFGGPNSRFASATFTPSTDSSDVFVNADSFLEGDEYHYTALVDPYSYASFATGGAVGYRIVLFDSIPEPANWALLIAGFGLVGAALRRRRLLAA